MKIRIQNCSTFEFYGLNGAWTKEAQSARDFQNSALALEFCQRHQLDDVQIVMKFEQDKYNLNLSVTPGAEPCQPQAGE
jgi:hypothetical protein